LAVAQELGLWIYYVVCEQEADIAKLNNTQVPWRIGDYAYAFASIGMADYQEIIEFSEVHDLALTTCIRILSNRPVTEGGGGSIQRFKDGKFKITTRELADRVAGLYREIGTKNICGRSFISALFGFCLIDGAEDERLISGAKRNPEALIKYGSRDGYLGMLEVLYNFRRPRSKAPIKIAAQNAIANHKTE